MKYIIKLANNADCYMLYIDTVQFWNKMHAADMLHIPSLFMLINKFRLMHFMFS